MQRHILFRMQRPCMLLRTCCRSIALQFLGLYGPVFQSSLTCLNDAFVPQ
jgi:hypothetical protein